MKICKKCNKEKRKIEFSKDKRRKDGCGSYCKDCDNERNRKRYDPNYQHNKFLRYKEAGYYKTEEFKEKNKIKCRKYAHENPEKISKYSLNWANKNKEKKRSYQEKWRKSNLKQKAANAYLQIQVREGYIVKPKSCTKCLKECVTEAHHEDYSKPLVVKWYCHRCHMKQHRKFNLE